MVHEPTGWNTWDFRGFNRLTFLDRGRTRITLLYAIWDDSIPPTTPDSKKTGRYYDCFRWDNVFRLGKHAPLGPPADIEFKAGETPYRVAVTQHGGVLRLSVTPLAATRQRIVFAFVAPVGETPEKTSPSSGRFAGFDIEFEGAGWPGDYFLNLAEPYAISGPGQAAIARVSGDVSAATRDSAPNTTGMTGDGALLDAPQAMLSALTWNTLFDTQRRLVVSPVSRDWCVDWCGPIVFCWDTYLAATQVAGESPELARCNFEAVTTAVDELGFVPNYYMSHGAASRDRSMPPIGAYLIWKTQAVDPDREWLEIIYPRLRTWHSFWMRRRNGNGSGLLSWGSDAEPHYEFPQLIPYNPTLRHSAAAAKWEAGLDNSPMYDDVAFNEQSNTLELEDVALCSYYAMDCESLADIAACLGRDEEAAEYRAELQAVGRRMNDRLWDEQHGIYCNRHWDGRLSRRWSPSSFFPLIAGVVPPARAERMVREHLLNPGEFWGEFAIPAIARNDPAYPDNDYWRGRIWGPFNFLVTQGLRRYRFDDVAAQLAEKGLCIMMRNWREDGGVYENYNADTGRGGDVWNAARLYHWGGLLALIAIEELIDVEPTGYLRIGSRRFPAAGIRQVCVGRSRFDVEIGVGVSATRDARPFLSSDTRAIVRLPVDGGADRPIEIDADEPGRLTLHAPWAQPRDARLADGSTRPAHRDGDAIVYEW